MTVLKGMFVGLRSVTENDAEFILKIRTDEKLAKFLNKTSPDIEMQKTWIRGQIARDGDYYFIIEDLKISVCSAQRTWAHSSSMEASTGPGGASSATGPQCPSPLAAMTVLDSSYPSNSLVVVPGSAALTSPSVSSTLMSVILLCSSHSAG